MTTIKTTLATESHPSADHPYTFSPECIDSLVEQANGLPVRVNFRGMPIGRVVDAERTTEGVSLTLDVDAESLPPVAERSRADR
jgi:hypothetical protein